MVIKWLITLALVANLSSCSEKAVSQEVSVGYKQNPQQISKQFFEVPPPAAIQELRQSLEIYQPQVTILNPQADEILQDNTVTVRLGLKDLLIFKDAELGIGPHLVAILDNQSHRIIHDVNQPIVFSDLSPGTHTLRVFAERPWNESFKNEGAYAQTTFHIFTKTDDNNPSPTSPVLTYNRPQGEYGAEPILFDFYLTNAPLHIAAKDNTNEGISDWRIRCTINGESFILDRWQEIYLKGFKPGKNWVKLEFLDNQGNPVKNVFNTTVGLFNYEPKGKDSLSQIIRGELSAEQVRSIVDPNYIVKPAVAEPTPIPTPTETPEIEPEEAIELLPTSEPQKESKQPEKPNGGYFNRRSRPTVEPTLVQPEPEPTTLPEKIEVQPEPEPTTLPEKIEVQPEPEPTTLPEIEPEQPKRKKLSEYITNRRIPQPTAKPTPELEIPATE